MKRLETYAVISKAEYNLLCPTFTYTFKPRRDVIHGGFLFFGNSQQYTACRNVTFVKVKIGFGLRSKRQRLESDDKGKRHLIAVRQVSLYGRNDSI